MYTDSNEDIVKTFKYHFCLFKMELYQSGANSYLIQIPLCFGKIADLAVLLLGSNLKVSAFEPLGKN